MLEQLFTIGHSNHPLDRFLSLLQLHTVQVVVDIRRFPGSRKHPHFNKANLVLELRKSDIEYAWLEALGGRRQKSPGDSVNLGLHNEAFRNYADYMLTKEFAQGLQRLREIGRSKKAAIMCAEGLFWQCHRRLVSDSLLAKEVIVFHIMPSGDLRQHALTPGARISAGKVSYPASTLFP